ncbi:hypothetical protein EV363DRAFT_1279862 [Boletus edulis]|nr:hypothetical protein EV363DRAFT_1279862 [Boletus edulis]
MFLERRGQRGGPGIYTLAGVTLPPRECTCHKYFSLYDKTFADSDDREYTASRWHSSYYRRSGSVSPLRAENELSFQVKVHGFPIEEAINSPSCSIPAGRSDHQVELLAMSNI